MTHWHVCLLVLIGILSTAVLFGTDMFFLTIGRAALGQASLGASTEVMGFFHLFADARMPIWGILAILSNLLLAVMSGNGHCWFYFMSDMMLLSFVFFYTRLAKPINKIQMEAAMNGASLAKGRELQAAWDRLLLVRVPLLLVSLLAQSMALLIASV